MSKMPEEKMVQGRAERPSCVALI